MISVHDQGGLQPSNSGRLSNRSSIGVIRAGQETPPRAATNESLHVVSAETAEQCLFRGYDVMLCCGNSIHADQRIMVHVQRLSHSDVADGFANESVDEWLHPRAVDGHRA